MAILFIQHLTFQKGKFTLYFSIFVLPFFINLDYFRFAEKRLGVRRMQNKKNELIAECDKHVEIMKLREDKVWGYYKKLLFSHKKVN